jgi:hypothetical protein
MIRTAVAAVLIGLPVITAAPAAAAPGTVTCSFPCTIIGETILNYAGLPAQTAAGYQALGPTTQTNYANFGSQTAAAYQNFGAETQSNYANFGANTAAGYQALGPTTQANYANFGAETLHNYLPGLH